MIKLEVIGLEMIELEVIRLEMIADRPPLTNIPLIYRHFLLDGYKLA